jgi:hypothetical protein
MKSSRVALLAALLISCSDADQISPPLQAVNTSANLTFLRFSDAAFAAAEKSGSFWAVAGQSRSLVLRYSDGAEFMRFDVGANTLESSDSVLISVQVDQTGALSFAFAPAGLQFNNSAPAILRIDHSRANADVDADGDVDLIDRILATQAGIWKRDLPLLPWVKIPSINLSGSVEQAKVYDFTSFGMAVD